MGASGFVVARTPPLFGRYLLPSDEEESAAPGVVIGHDVWRARFAADPSVIGRTVLLAGTPTTIVGIMPAGFGFPIDHQFWIPFSVDPSKYLPWRGPELHLFGRLPVLASLLRPCFSERSRCSWSWSHHWLPSVRHAGACESRPSRRCGGTDSAECPDKVAHLHIARISDQGPS